MPEFESRYTGPQIDDGITKAGNAATQSALTAETNARVAADNALGGRIDATQTSVSALQADATAKWVLLNDVDNRTRVLENTVGNLNDLLQARLAGA